MVMTLGVGSRARLAFGYETSFGAGGTADQPFGQNARLTGITPRNNIEAIFNIGRREAAKYMALRFEGGWSIETMLSTDSWMQAVLGTKSAITDPNTGATIGYTYTKANTPSSIVIEVGFEGTENVLRTLVGAVVRRASIDCRVNEPVRVRLDGMYAKETVSSPTSITAVEDTNDIMTFADGSLEFPSDTVLANIQAISFDIDTGHEMIYTIGQRTAANTFARAFTVSGRFSAVAENDDYVRYMLGLGDVTQSTVSEAAITEQTLKLTFDNGSNKLVASFDGVVIDEIGSAIEANELIMFDVVFRARDVMFEWYI